MSLIEDWISKGGAASQKALTEHGESTVNDLLTRLEGLLPPAGTPDAHAATIRGMSLDAIERLRRQTPALLGATRNGLTVAMTHLATNDEEGALGVYLHDRAGPDDLVRASLATSLGMIDDRKKREANLEEWKQLGLSLLREVGPIAARYLLPLLLRA